MYRRPHCSTVGPMRRYKRRGVRRQQLRARRAVLRAVADAVLAEADAAGLREMAVVLSLKLADALERISAAEGLTAADLADVLFVGNLDCAVTARESRRSQRGPVVRPSLRRRRARGAAHPGGRGLVHAAVTSPLYGRHGTTAGRRAAAARGHRRRLRDLADLGDAPWPGAAPDAPCGSSSGTGARGPRSARG